MITSSNLVRYWGGLRKKEEGKEENKGGVCIKKISPPSPQVTSTLRFTRQGIRYDDQGRYRCVASNAHTTPASSEYTYITVRRK